MSGYRKLSNPRRPLLMMRGRGLIGPMVQQGNKVASPKSRRGVKPVGNFILYKINNP